MKAELDKTQREKKDLHEQVVVLRSKDMENTQRYQNSQALLAESEQAMKGAKSDIRRYQERVEKLEEEAREFQASRSTDTNFAYDILGDTLDNNDRSGYVKVDRLKC